MIATGAGVVAIGTGGRRYAKAFIEDERVPFPVFLDEEGSAAEIVGTGTIGAVSMVKPAQVAAGLRSFAKGHRQHKTGRRPTQLGGTIVMGPGDVILYEDVEEHAGDHADIDEIVAVLRG